MLEGEQDRIVFEIIHEAYGLASEATEELRNFVGERRLPLVAEA